MTSNFPTSDLENWEGKLETATPAKTSAVQIQDLRNTTFCFDYQKNNCIRSHCKFIHATFEEEKHFLKTGKLPDHLSNATNSNVASSLVINASSSSPAKQGEVCKDFLNNKCNRGAFCKFAHLNPAEAATFKGGICAPNGTHFSPDFVNSNDRLMLYTRDASPQIACEFPSPSAYAPSKRNAVEWSSSQDWLTLKKQVEYLSEEKKLLMGKVESLEQKVNYMFALMHQQAVPFNTHLPEPFGVGYPSFTPRVQKSPAIPR